MTVASWAPSTWHHHLHLSVHFYYSLSNHIFDKISLCSLTNIMLAYFTQMISHILPLHGYTLSIYHLQGFLKKQGNKHTDDRNFIMTSFIWVTMVYIKPPHSFHWHLNICPTVAPMLASQYRINFCPVSVACLTLLPKSFLLRNSKSWEMLDLTANWICDWLQHYGW
jgi:hypothetical protein